MSSRKRSEFATRNKERNQEELTSSIFLNEDVVQPVRRALLVGWGLLFCAAGGWQDLQSKLLLAAPASWPIGMAFGPAQVVQSACCKSRDFGTRKGRCWKYPYVGAGLGETWPTTWWSGVEMACWIMALLLVLNLPHIKYME